MSESNKTYDLAKAVGYEFPDTPVSWLARDLILYAVGIGAKKDDFTFVYELDESFAAFPTYPVVLFFKGISQDVVNFVKLAAGGTQPPGLPKFDPNRVVHGAQSIEMYKPIPVESGAGWKLKRKIIGVHENKSGIIIDGEAILVDSHDTPYCRMISSSFNLGAKANGNFSQMIGRIPAGKPIPKDRKPDYIVTESTTEEQAIVYRLSGDYNALHIDPSIGQRAGFGGVILHGLASYGFAARAVLKAVGGDDPSSLKTFGVRFTSPVKPGEALETSMWEVGSGPDDTTEIAFVTKNMATGKVCLGGGVAYVKKSNKSRL
ncbi:hypothetical protein FRB96_008634 [Tulasnella sp. 330]|nr:hypothetical protein FRB96_008634 [Tulasnella sp. 330]